MEWTILLLRSRRQDRRVPSQCSSSPRHRDWRLQLRGHGRALRCGVRKQLLQTAEAVAGAGARILRGGAYKPRSSPYAFQGLGVEGLKILRKAREETGLAISTEVMSEEDVDLIAEYADIMQVGTRSMENYALLEALGTRVQGISGLRCLVRVPRNLSTHLRFLHS